MCYDIVRLSVSTTKAIQDFGAAIGLDPRPAIPYYGRGNAYLQKGQVARAVQDYGEAIRRDPRDPDFHHNRGRVYQAPGQKPQADADFGMERRLRSGKSPSPPPRKPR